MVRILTACQIVVDFVQEMTLSGYFLSVKEDIAQNMAKAKHHIWSHKKTFISSLF